MINFLPKKWAGNFYLGLIITISIYEIFDNISNKEKEEFKNNLKTAFKKSLKAGAIVGAAGSLGSGLLRLHHSNYIKKILSKDE